MIAAKDFLLERFVCQVFSGRARASRALVEEAITRGLSAESALCQLIWPTLECVEGLRRDGVLARKTYQTALMILRGLAAETGLRLLRAPATGTGALVCFSQPVINELPAQIMADIADAAGWDVTWMRSTAHISSVIDALRLNRPRAILLCVPAGGDVDEAYLVLKRLHAATPWARFLLLPMMPALHTDWPRIHDTTVVRDPGELAILLSEFIGSEMACDGPSAISNLRFRYG